MAGPRTWNGTYGILTPAHQCALHTARFMHDHRISEEALETVARAGLCDDTLRVDATDAVETLGLVEARGGPFDLVVSCASAPGTEMASILAVKDGGTVLFFSMATSFTAAALGAEGVGKDATLLVGNGYVPGHADLTLDLLRRNAALRALFEARYVRG